MKHETGICYNCGADQGLRHYETMQCPRYGIEETKENIKYIIKECELWLNLYG